MAINTQTLFDQKRIQFGQGAGSVRFQNDFIQAVNRSIADFNDKALGSVSAISDVQTNIDADSKHEATFSMCIDFHLAHMGAYGDRKLAELSALRTDALRTAQMQNQKDTVPTGGSETGMTGKLGNIADIRETSDDDEDS